MLNRPIDDLVLIAAVGGGFHIDHKRPTDDLVKIAAAASAKQAPNNNPRRFKEANRRFGSYSRCGKGCGRFRGLTTIRSRALKRKPRSLIWGTVTSGV
jgi:hypothetical protein